ncbi:hypothetical protein ABZ700_22950, partial [Streptomyces diastaticus]
DFSATNLVDLADRRLGAGVIAANDEFFAQRETDSRAAVATDRNSLREPGRNWNHFLESVSGKGVLG